jgi:flavodoxin
MKALIAYFSRPGDNYVGGKIEKLSVGNTEAAAKIAARLTGADEYRIDTAKPYPEDYEETTEAAKQELRQNARPQLSTPLKTIDAYTHIILGYPNWWGTMPMAVFTFLESFDFSDLTLAPFCTHEGSGLGKSESDIKRLCPKATVLPGLAIRGGEARNAEPAIAVWLEKYGLITRR